MIRIATTQDIPQIASIHLKALPDDLLPRLGEAFLIKEFYPRILRSENTFNLVNDDNGTVNAFCIFTYDSHKLTDQITRDKITLAGYLALSLLKDFRVINEVLALLKGPTIQLNPGEADYLNAGLPEIYIIATHPQYQSRGLGKAIITKGLAVLFEKYPACIVRTSAERAREFYLRFGFSQFGAEYRGKRKLHLLVYKSQKE